MSSTRQQAFALVIKRTQHGMPGDKAIVSHGQSEGDKMKLWEEIEANGHKNTEKTCVAIQKFSTKTKKVRGLGCKWKW